MTGAAPTATTVRFGLLIAVVLAVSAGMFVVIQGFLPGRADAQRERIAGCAAELERDPAFTGASPGQRDRLLAATARYRACLRPVLGDMTAAVATGFALLSGVAAVSYVAHPWWLVRRRRLKRLSAADSPNLFGFLDQLRREMGLSRSPDWRIAPYRRTSGGQAFGPAWHRYVQLDAGLLVRFATDRPAFRAVVLHELAHLRNRDVDKTYLTIGIWWAFLVVAVLPLALLRLHANLFAAPFDWDWRETAGGSVAWKAYQLGVLLAVTALVQLTRNAVLRVRETHADAVAAAHDGAGSALPAVLERLPPQRRRWGTHPDPARRLAAVRDPGLLLVAGPGEPAGAGLAGGVFAANLTLLLGTVAGFDPTLGIGMVGLVTGAAMAAVLAVCVWRATAAAPSRGPSIRTWLGLPLALTGGFLVGSQIRLDTRPGLPTAPSWILSALLLAAGAVVMAVWVASAARGILAAPRPRRWAMPAVVATTVVAFATGFATWLPGRDGFGLLWSAPPASGADIGWYAWAVAATGWQLQPAAYLVYFPLTLPVVTLLWLVPVVAGLRRPGVAGDRIPLRRAVIAGLVGGGCAVLIGAVLPILAKAALPASVRRLPDSDALAGSFPLIIVNATYVTGIVAVVLVLAVVVGRGGRHRPALAALAATVTALLTAAGVNHVAVPMQCRANVFDLDPPPRSCVQPVDVGSLAELVNTILVEGMVVAVPIVLIAAALAHYAWPRPDRPPVPLSGHGYLATVVTVGLFVVVVGWLTWGILPDFAITWLEPTFG